MKPIKTGIVIDFFILTIRNLKKKLFPVLNMIRDILAPDEVLKPVEMEFCTNTETARANLLSLTITFVKKVLPAGKYRV